MLGSYRAIFRYTRSCSLADTSRVVPAREFTRAGRVSISIHKFNFFGTFIPEGCPLALVPLLVLIELASYCSRAISLGVRLFSNMTAGHVLLAILSNFFFKAFSSGLIIFLLTLIPFLLFIAILVLELSVSFIQAYVFILLTCSYIKGAIHLH